MSVFYFRPKTLRLSWRWGTSTSKKWPNLYDTGPAPPTIRANFNIFVLIFIFNFQLVKRQGNLPLEKVIDIARQMRPRSMRDELSGTVKEILGSCHSMHVNVEGQNAHDIIEKIRSGKIIIPKE